LQRVDERPVAHAGATSSRYGFCAGYKGSLPIRGLAVRYTASFEKFAGKVSRCPAHAESDAFGDHAAHRASVKIFEITRSDM
jgi:hypothetical protein